MENSKVIVPPIKCQGIKTKIVPFIKEKVERNTDGVWIEPFVGTGVVAFNMAPQKAILCDKNQYIIALYQGIQNGTITNQILVEKDPIFSVLPDPGLSPAILYFSWMKYFTSQ